MKLKIQPIAVDANSKNDWHEFLIAIRDIKPGSSFIVKAVPSNYRLILSASKVLLKKEFAVRKFDGGYRIGRIA